ncbi:MAG: hypothetical protein H8E28_01300 [Anaerolineae bacterium]|nr:hypothetical protein [Anaerolineae bacterium]
MKPKGMLIAFVAVALLSLLVAAIIPDIEAQDDRVQWEPSMLNTATATATPTGGWYDDLPTPAYATATATLDPTEAMTATPGPSATPLTPTMGLDDVLMTITAEANDEQ